MLLTTKDPRDDTATNQVTCNEFNGTRLRLIRRQDGDWSIVVDGDDGYMRVGVAGIPDRELQSVIAQYFAQCDEGTEIHDKKRKLS